MLNKDNNQEPLNPNAMPKNTVPNEHAGFAVEGFVKIYDPQTQETLVEIRA